MDELQDEAIPWHAPGLLWRVQEHRRLRQAKRRVGVPLRQRLRERGLHWSTELIVGMFFAVGVAAFVAVLAVRTGVGTPADVAAHAGAGSAGASPVVQATPAPALCFIGDVARPCH